MEQIISNELYDEFRVESGILVKVSKDTVLRDRKFKSDKLKSRKYKKKVRGFSNIYELKRDLECDCGTILPKGTYIYSFWSKECEIVVPTKNPEDYYVEVTCSGGAIGGCGYESIRKINKVVTLLADRYGLK